MTDDVDDLVRSSAWGAAVPAAMTAPAHAAAPHLFLVPTGTRRVQPGDVVQLVYVGDDGSETVALEITVPEDSAA